MRVLNKLLFMTSLVLTSALSCKLKQEKFASSGPSNTASVPNPVDLGADVKDPVIATPTPTTPPQEATSTPAPTATPAPEVPYVYPVIDYYATGLLHNSGNDYKVSRDLNVSLDAAQFVADVLSFRSSNGNVDGKIKKSIGPSNYALLPNATFRTMDEKAKAAGTQRPFNFALYSTKVVSLFKDTFTFADPVPFFIRPGAEGLYKPLEAGPLTVKTSVNAIIKAVPKTFTMQMVFTKMPTIELDTAIIQVQMTIPEDDNATNKKDQGALYGAFPLDKTAIYKIDTKNGIVKGISTATDYNDNTREKIELTYKACKMVRGETTTNYDCGKPAK